MDAQGEKLPEPNTLCRDCVFADYEDGRQVGCHLGRTAIFSQQHCLAEVVEKDVVSLAVVGRTCNAHRGASWGRKYAPPEAWAERVREEIAFRPDAIVLLRGAGTGLVALERTIQSLLTQTAPGRFQSLIVAQHSTEHPAEVIDLLRRVWPRTWSRVGVLRDENGPPPAELLIDQAFLKVTAPWYCVFESGFQVHPEFCNHLDEQLNKQLEKFSFLTPLPGSMNGMVCQSVLHRNKFVQGHGKCLSAEKDREICGVREKVLDLQPEVEQKGYIRGVQAVCPFLG